MDIHPEVRIGHVHLRVADIERSRKFYRDLIGFHETTHYDDQSAFFAAGDYHHHIAVNVWARRDPEDCSGSSPRGCQRGRSPRSPWPRPVTTKAEPRRCDRPRSRGGAPPPPGSTGLYHFAILYPNRKELARAVQRLLDADWPIDGASDHGVSEAIYLRDPDGNGIELYRDRPPEEWTREREGPTSPSPSGRAGLRGAGKLVMPTKPLELEDLLAELAR